MLSQSSTVSEGEYAACLEAWWKMIPVPDFKLLIPRINGVREPNMDIDVLLVRAMRSLESENRDTENGHQNGVVEMKL